MPLMVTFFNVRKGRDTLFKRGMRHFFPRTARRYEAEYGIRFIGWFNVTEGSEWDNLIILDLPNYAVLDQLYADPGARGFGHRVAESIFDKQAHHLPARADGPRLRVQAVSCAARIAALRELAQEAELERRDFLYEATEQLRRFIDANRERLREIGPIKLVDDDQDYLLFHPVDETWTTRLTYQDPADSEWYDEEQMLESFCEIVELYNPADIFAWFVRGRPRPGQPPHAGGRAGRARRRSPRSRTRRTGSRACRQPSRRRSPRSGCGSWPMRSATRSASSRSRCCASSRPTRRTCWPDRRPAAAGRDR